MFCNQCGASNQDTARFCNGCGSSLADQTFHPSQNADHSQQKKNDSAKSIGIAIAASVCLLIGAIVIGSIAQKISRSQPEFNRTKGIVKSVADSTEALLPTPTPEPQRHTIPVAKKAITVDALSYSWFEFDIPKGSQNAYLVGSFEATGGTGNDVQVVVVDSIGFTNFKNGHQFRTPYSTQRITTDNLNVKMRPGHYYLIFNNKFSMLTPKAITIDIELHYETQ